jgi:hypothetical protein
MKTTLKEFFEKNSFNGRSGKFANAVQDLTLEEFLNTCERGDWITSLFKATKSDWRKLIEANFHCANLIRDKIKNKDVRIVWAMDAALKVAKNPFYEDPGNKEYLEKYLNYARGAEGLANELFRYHYDLNTWSNKKCLEHKLSDLGVIFTNIDFYFNGGNSRNVVSIVCKYFEYEAFISFCEKADGNTEINKLRSEANEVSEKVYQKYLKLTADICRQYLPIECWNQDLLKSQKETT